MAHGNLVWRRNGPINISADQLNTANFTKGKASHPVAIDAEDGTVPASASAAQLAQLPGCQLACAHNPGYEHSASYAQDKVRQTVLDAIVRLIALAALT